MIYQFKCPDCGHEQDVVRKVEEMDQSESCTACPGAMHRIFVAPKIHLYNTKVQETYFHHGLGQVVKGDNHAREIAKEKGMIEVGNERMDKHVKVEVDDYSSI